MDARRDYRCVLRVWRLLLLIAVVTVVQQSEVGASPVSSKSVTHEGTELGDYASTGGIGV